MLRWGSCKMIDVISKPVFKVATLLIIGVSCTSSTGVNSSSKTFIEPISAAPTQTANEKNIWMQMRKGSGYVVLLRHTQTVSGTGDPPGFRLNDCTTQRNLSQLGREQAIRIGKVFRKRKIPVSKVISSQYCRCLDTAKLLNLGTVEPSAMLNSIFEDRSITAMRNKQVRQQIVNHRNSSGVIIMVSHFANIGALSGINPQPGGAVVMRVNQQQVIEVVGQIQSF
jgi:phosphohistidine phosphatase SixA